MKISHVVEVKTSEEGSLPSLHSSGYFEAEQTKQRRRSFASKTALSPRILPTPIGSFPFSENEFSVKRLRKQSTPVISVSVPTQKRTPSSFKPESVSDPKMFSSSFATDVSLTPDLPQIPIASNPVGEIDSIDSLCGNASESSGDSFNRKEFMEYMTTPKLGLIHPAQNYTPKFNGIQEKFITIAEPWIDPDLEDDPMIKKTLQRRTTVRRLDIQSEVGKVGTSADNFSRSFLLPAFDSKGSPALLSSFDQSDLDSMHFGLNGLHPKSKFQTNFDLILIGVHIASICFVPFLIGFHDLIDPTTTNFFDAIITAVYFLEALLSLVTPMSELKSRIYSIREYEMMRPYLSDWIISQSFQLILDVLSTLPFRTIFNSLNGCEFFLLLRLIRIFRLPGIVHRCAYCTKLQLHTEKLMGVGGSKIVPIGLTIFVFIHYNACMLYYSGRSNGFVGWETFWFGLKSANLWDSYVLAFLLGVGNMFPMSFKPQTISEQLIDIFFIFAGACLYAILVGYISSAAISFDNSGRLYNQKMEELIDYIKWKKLSPETRQKLVSYYETKYRGKYFEEETLLADMNESLRTEISLHNTRNLIMKVPFLQRETGDHRDEIFYSRIASALHARYYIPGDSITKQGESGADMFFILSGKVDVFVDGRYRVSLYDGSYFGEVALITKVLRTATVQATMPSVLYRLTNKDFHTIITEFPDIKQRIDVLAFEREKLLALAESARAEQEGEKEESKIQLEGQIDEDISDGKIH
ncbi:hypothetical protein BCR33DRAFT_851208 [Rhizoclosmatium globosum]|uniref:Cyclic nucleotide-binding domain-containing protein n=1 Tax=Rhizoclosmatium globosum TaxID=329046 RepID=A0A1Y2CAY7_9FUNG|nr:hypothetical protein BCR33DRAFT_851208 [Rhizoclosmatium globosum]|eukprot:ORY43495.1 hypothetical protein BCR33DRAFT_851208 [Rhizoclosmatium globosum]